MVKNGNDKLTTGFSIEDFKNAAKAVYNAGISISDLRKPLKINGPDFVCCEFI